MFRHRRRIAPLVAALAGIVPLSLATHSASGAPLPVLSAQVTGTETGQPMAPGFLGFSIEFRGLHQYVGRDPNTVNPVFVGLVRGLNPGQAPSLRIGGDSTDQTWWPVRHAVPPVGITYALTKDWLHVTRAVASKLGARLILGVNLSANRPALAAAEARAFLAGIGRRYIEALEIGNESDVYTIFPWYRDRRSHVVFARPPSYDMSDFIGDFSRWRAVIPPLPLAGPAFAGLTWMADLGTFIAAERPLALVTFHRYPLRGCEHDVTAPDYASIPNLLSDRSASGLAHQVAPFVTTAHDDGTPFRLDELNSAACTGRAGVSDTFASALWGLDTLFSLASVGVDGVNIHTLPGAAYQPFVFKRTGKRWSAFVRPLYYGLLMFEQAFPPGAKLLQVNAPSGDVKVWATQGTDGRIRVVVINKDAASGANVQLQLPGAATQMSAITLQARSLGATSGVQIGGASFGSSTTTGVLPPTSSSTVDPVLGTYSVTVPAGSAVLMTR